MVGRIDRKPETVEEVDTFLDWVRKTEPRSTDGRSRWDAIGLRTDIPSRRKMALENNPEFLDQHNDSLSLGMLEFSKPAPGESVVRNLGARACVTALFAANLSLLSGDRLGACTEMNDEANFSLLTDYLLLFRKANYFGAAPVPVPEKSAQRACVQALVATGYNPLQGKRVESCAGAQAIPQ